LRKNLSSDFNNSPSKMKLSGPLEKAMDSGRSKISQKIHNHIMSATFIVPLKRFSKSEPRNGDSDEFDEIPK